MKVFYNSKLAKLLLLPGFSTIFLFGAVFTKEESLSDATLRHESVHAFQYATLFITGLILSFAAVILWFAIGTPSWRMLWTLTIGPFLFYLWYLVEYVVRFVKAIVDDPGSVIEDWHLLAYRDIAFEQEAREYEGQEWTKGEDVYSFSFLKFLKN